VQSNVNPVANKMTLLKASDSVVTGVDAFAAAGHTAFQFESEGKAPALHCRCPQPLHHVDAKARLHVRFDKDKEGAAATRRTLLGMAAADGIPIAGYHMPFPAVGYVEVNSGGGYRYNAVSYQLSL
tara:strand:+ start:98 stop:475 length:378 start_codon:yes stop_codon:yes gene_type:complete